jgi:hypothetical protein
MATPANRSNRPLSQETQKLLLASCNSAVTNYQTQATELRSKMEIIDIAYARFKQKSTRAKEEAGVDRAYDASCDTEFDALREKFVDIDIPMLVSQVDTAVGYLADLYLSGYPLFPVVSEPKDKLAAEYIEALIDKHSIVGKYPQELLKFFWDSVKYNFGPLLCEWDNIQHFIRASDFDAGLEGKPSLAQQEIGFTKLKRLDPYNTFYDMTVSPGDVAATGDYAGYIEQITPTKLHRLIEKLESAPGHLMNTTKVFTSNAGDSSNYYQHPQVSEYITSKSKEFSWENYFSAQDPNRKTSGAVTSGMHELAIHYKRLVPNDFKITAPDDYKNRLRIYKVITVDAAHILYVEPVYSSLEHLPILIGAPRDDGMGLQTQSVAESVIPMQRAASTLVNIRFHAARRAINDRAIFDDSMIDPQALNNPSPSAKIAAKQNSLTQRKLSDSYYSIPYDSRGTETVLRDALLINDWTNELNGMNRSQQGQFQKGNKTMSEFNTVMDNAEMRQRLPAIMLEFQVFVPMKQMLKLNIWRYASSEIIRSQATGRALEADLNNLDQNLFDFRVADGYLPKSKLANTDLITGALQMIQSSELLQQMYGPNLPGLLEHMMQLGGVRGFDQYAPAPPEGQPDPNAIQNPQVTQVPGGPPAGAEPPVEGGVV